MGKERHSDAQGTTGEAIGRPQEWGEGRYQQAGKPPDEDVTRSEKDNPPTPDSAPVTREDYEKLPQPRPSAEAGRVRR